MIALLLGAQMMNFGIFDYSDTLKVNPVTPEHECLVHGGLVVAVPCVLQE